MLFIRTDPHTFYYILLLAQICILFEVLPKNVIIHSFILNTPLQKHELHGIETRRSSYIGRNCKLLNQFFWLQVFFHYCLTLSLMVHISNQWFIQIWHTIPNLVIMQFEWLELIGPMMKKLQFGEVFVGRRIVDSTNEVKRHKLRLRIYSVFFLINTIVYFVWWVLNDFYLPGIKK